MSDAILNALWRASWQGALVIAALWCLFRSLEKRLPADIRCWLWRAAYIKLLTGLVVSGSVILPILPVAETLTLSQTTFARTVMVNTVTAVSPATRLIQQTVKTQTIALSAPAWSWQAALATLYLLGIGACVFRVARAGLRTRQILRGAVLSADAEAQSDLARLALRLDLRRVPRLMTSADIEIPVYTAGIVLLPSQADYAPQERLLILAHELAHARRRDLAWEWLGTLTQTIFFFHPLVLLARREERLTRESAADALALRITEAPASTYGKLLLTISLSRPGKSLAGAIGVIEHGSLLRRRLLALKEISPMPLSRKSVLRVAVPLFIGSALVFVPWQVKAASWQWRSLTPTLSVLTFAPRTVTKKPVTSAEKAKAAIESGDTKSATKYALQMLAKNTDTKDWNYGNVIHGANQILGLAALRENRVADTKKYLIAAGNTPGSPQLDSFGPDMVLAQQLLNKDEKGVVIQYLDLVAGFWAHSSKSSLARQEKSQPGLAAKVVRMNRDTQTKIDGWKQQIMAGQKPTLNMSSSLRLIGPSNGAKPQR